MLSSIHKTPAILDHVWGISAAQDRIWGQVSGLRPDKAGSRIFMVMQAFIDESIDKSGVFVLGGYISSAESWAKFSSEWERMLPKFGTLNERGHYHFKMSEMAMNDERMGRVPSFFRIIEENVIGWVSARLNENDLKRAISRIIVPGVKIDWDRYGNSYYMAFRSLIDMFHLRRPEMQEAIPLGDKIDFYFDNRVEKKSIIEMWDNYIKERPEEIKQYYGATPRFEDDEEFLPLQAADFWAWWVRKWCVEGTPEKIRKCDFGSYSLKGKKKFLKIDILINEDQLVKVLKNALRAEIGSNHIIYDSGPHFS